MSSVAVEFQERLDALSGNGSLKEKVTTAKRRLCDVHNRWRSPQAPGRIYRFLKGYQKPQIEEVEDVRAAHARFCLDEIEANRETNRRLAAEFLAFLEQSSRIDAEFFRPQVEAMRERLHRIGIEVPEDGRMD